MKKKLSALTVLACAYAAFGLEISPVLEGKMAAFSFTYDDGAYSHYTTALPMHLKYGMPATFFIITDRVEQDGEGRAKKYCSWAEVKEMAGKGMEMASHTKTHRNMRDLESAGLTKEMMKGKTRAELFAMREPNWPTVWSEIELSREALESHTGQKVRTYAFAGNAYPDWTGRIVSTARIYTRENLRIATGRTDTEEGYRKQLDEKIVVSNNVSCCMIHGVGTGDGGDGWNPIPSVEVYESLLRLVAERRDRLHVDTFGNNAAYKARARNTRLVPVADKPGEYRLVFAEKPKDICEPGEIWLRLAPGEKVEVNGKPAAPNAQNAVLAHTGDTIIAISPGVL
jgi:peptidoglycan/xylan/chitin deacetylase (PgdA/CDA1 family)